MSAPGFGKGTDHFGLETAALQLIESSRTPKPISVEIVQDQDGNNAGLGSYDGGPAEAIECVYRLISGTLDLSTLALGYALVGAVKTCKVSMAVATSNGEWPMITVSGFKGVTNETEFPAFTLPAITISALKQAQALDFTVGANCRLTGSTFTISGEFHHALGSTGTVGAMAFTGATQEITAEAVEIDGLVVLTPAVGWTETQGEGTANSNIGWGTGSMAATKYQAPDP